MAIEKKQNIKNIKSKTDNKLSYAKHKFPGMLGKLKKFNQTLSNKYDKKARDVIKVCLEDGVIDNPSIYGEDMLVITNRIPYGYIELQVYGTWIDKFPYSAPFVFERKMRFDNNTLFVCFNARFDQALIFSKNCISNQKVRSETYSDEYIHFVPWRNVIIVKVEKLNLGLILNYSDPESYFRLEEIRDTLRNSGLSDDEIEDIIDNEI